MSTNHDDRLDRDDDLAATARTLHREWESPELWPAIAARIADEDRARARVRWPSWRLHAGWQWATAAAAILTVGLSLAWFGTRAWDAPGRPSRANHAERVLLSDPALAEIEAAEAQYARAIEKLAGAAADRAAELPDSPLVASLRERLLAIDAALEECRAEIERNRFNAHLRRQLLLIYQEKRRTLEQILELEQHAS